MSSRPVIFISAVSKELRQQRELCDKEDIVSGDIPCQRRRTVQFRLAMVGLLFLSAGDLHHVCGQQQSEEQPIKPMNQRQELMLQILREHTQATSMDCDHALQEEKHHLAPGSLEKELPQFAKQLLARADTAALDRANAYYVTEQFAQAEAAALQARDQARSASGQPALQLFLALELAGKAAHEQNQYVRAQEHYRAAAAQTSEASNPLQWARVQEGIAAALAANGDYDEAETLYTENVFLYKKHRGAEHPDTLISRNNLATTLQYQGRYFEAEQEHRAVLAIRQRVLGAEHHETLNSRSNLATVLQEQGEYDEAEQEHRAVFAICHRVLGAEHHDTLTSWNNLATALQDQERYNEAEQEHRSILAIMRRVRGAEHPDTLTSQSNLAGVLRAQGKHAEAEQEHRAVLAIRQRILGAEHPDTLTSRSNLATALKVQGKNAEAEQEHRAVLAIRQRTLGLEHPQVFATCYSLALCLRDQDKLPEALELMQAAEAGWRKALGADHPYSQRAKEGVELLQEELRDQQK